MKIFVSFSVVWLSSVFFVLFFALFICSFSDSFLIDCGFFFASRSGFNFCCFFSVSSSSSLASALFFFVSGFFGFNFSFV